MVAGIATSCVITKTIEELANDSCVKNDEIDIFI